MLTLKFNIFDSLFVDDLFYQIITNKEQTKVILRDFNGEKHILPSNSFIDIYPNCMAKVEPMDKYFSNFKIYFDAPKNIKISRPPVYTYDDINDEVMPIRATERTIDQILEEEFRVNIDFTTEFISHCFSEIIYKINEVIFTQRSAVQAITGGDETDILIVFTLKGKKFALLIENKIDAPKQERQPERYIERGINGVLAGLWDTFETCLIAPKQYLDSHMSNDYYHNYISYEDIIEFFEKTIKNDKRKQYRKTQFKEAIKKRARSHGPEAPNIPQVVKFIESFRECANEHLPEFSFEASKANNKNVWFYFSKNNYPENVKIIIQMNAIILDLPLPRFSKLLTHVEDVLKGTDYTFNLTKSGTTCSIRHVIPSVNCLIPFEDQKENMRSNLEIVEKFSDFFNAKIATFSK